MDEHQEYLSDLGVADEVFITAAAITTIVRMRVEREGGGVVARSWVSALKSWNEQERRLGSGIRPNLLPSHSFRQPHYCFFVK